MKYLKRYNESLDNEEIHSICKKYGIKNYTINEDGSIDVYDGVYLSRKGLTKLPLRFRDVRGDFDCSRNELTSLKGAPKSVGGDFNVSHNQLRSLEGAPESVGGAFYCHSNKLTSLKGVLQSIDGNFICYDNKLTSLEDAPKYIGGIFDCSFNKLKSLDGLEFKSFKNIDLRGNPIYPVVKDWINSDNKEELIEYFVDMGVIQGNKLIHQRLFSFYSEAGFYDFKDYEIVRM